MLNARGWKGSDVTLLVAKVEQLIGCIASALPHQVHWARSDTVLMTGLRCTLQDRDSLVYETGVMKLADFGLSKSLPMNKHAGFDLEDKFKLTGETGSYRYMAPEVFRHEPYNYKVRARALLLFIQHL